MIYAVLLALVVIAVREELEAASATVREEASALADVFWLARRLPEPEGPRIQELARSYATVVSEEEWELMARGRVPVPTRESQNTQPPELQFRATLGDEPEVELALVWVHETCSWQRVGSGIGTSCWVWFPEEGSSA